MLKPLSIPVCFFFIIIKVLRLICIKLLFAFKDGNGGIWHIDLNTEKGSEPSVQLYKSHSGPVADIAASPWGNYFATLGTDGRFFVYNYMAKRMIYHHDFPAKGKCILWLPLGVSKLNSSDRI